MLLIVVVMCMTMNYIYKILDVVIYMEASDALSTFGFALRAVHDRVVAASVQQ